MADTAARLALSARRNEVARFTIVVTGIDMTGVAMAMQVRQTVDNPFLLFALGTVNTLAAEGLKLDSVTVKDGVPTSIIKGRINASTMTDATKVPYTGEIGDNTVLAYAMQWTLNGDAQTRLYGNFVVTASAFGSDGAPTNRPASYGSPSATCGGTSSESLLFGDQVIAVSIDGAELVGGEVAKAQAAAQDARDARDAVKPMSGQGVPAPSLGIDGGIYYDVSDPLNPVLYGPKSGGAWGSGRSLKGAPGGNAMAIGPLSALGVLPIPQGYDSISTSGYATAGDRGRAFYRRISTGPSSRTRRQSADGAWWQLDERAHYPPYYGAKGDGSDDTAAIQDAIDNLASGGGGTLYIDKLYSVSALTLRARVVLLGREGFRGAGLSSGFRALQSGADLLTVPNGAEYESAGMIGLGLQGAVLGGGRMKRGVVLLGAGSLLRNVTVYGSDEEAIYERGIVNLIEHCGAFDALQARPARKGGCLWMAGTDGRVIHFEGATGQNGPAGEKNVTGPGLNAACVYVTGSNNTLVDAIGQLCDVGIRDEGAHNKFAACRADRNYGHGIHAGGVGSTWAGTVALNNSLGQTATYDGFFVTGTGNNFAGAKANSTGDDIHQTGPHYHRYGGNDTAITNTIGAQNKWVGFDGGAAENGPLKNTSTGQTGIMFPTEQRTVTLAAGSQTVDIRGACAITITANSAAVITDFPSGVEGQTLAVLGNANVTIQHNSAIILRSAANKIMRADIPIVFRRQIGKWREITDTGPRDSGWTPMTAAAPYKGALSAYEVAGTATPAAYDQTFITGLVNGLRGLSQRFTALETANRNAGIIG